MKICECKHGQEKHLGIKHFCDSTYQHCDISYEECLTPKCGCGKFEEMSKWC